VADRGEQLWTEIQSYRGPAPPVSYRSRVPERDADDDELGEPSAQPDWGAQSITGRTILLSYEDAKKQTSDRLVLCRRLAEKASVLYLDAFCYVREQPRSFRADRIVAITDHETGEVHTSGLAYLGHFLPDSQSPAPFRYGLSPGQYADVNAALNVLAFIARCDGRWHPLEADAILEFAGRYWLRAEIPCDFDEAEILRHAARLAPDAEAFWVSIHRCAANAVLRTIIRRHVAEVIDADGVHHALEQYWGAQVDQFLAD
jgi:hypothetical protein